MQTLNIINSFEGEISFLMIDWVLTYNKTSETVFVLKQRFYFKIIFLNIPDE